MPRSTVVGRLFHTVGQPRDGPAYLGSLPFGADSDELAASPEFAAVTDAAEKCAPEPEDPDEVASRQVALEMTIDAEFAASLKGCAGPPPSCGCDRLPPIGKAAGWKCSYDCKAHPA